MNRKSLPAKHAKGAKGLKERTCKRCGCTTSRACAGGCAWVLGTDVCERCLTDVEFFLWASANDLRGMAEDFRSRTGRLLLRAQAAETMLCLMLRRAKRKGRR